MIIYCLDDFKTEVERLKRKNPYRAIEEDLIKFFFNTSIDKLKSGTRLNNSETTPYIKKRINGSGGYRVYYLLIIKEEKVYLMYVHPKTGPFGTPNITEEAKAELYKDVLNAIKTNNLYVVKPSSNNKTLEFEKMVVGNLKSSHK